MAHPCSEAAPPVPGWGRVGVETMSALFRLSRRRWCCCRVRLGYCAASAAFSRVEEHLLRTPVVRCGCLLSFFLSLFLPFFPPHIPSIFADMADVLPRRRARGVQDSMARPSTGPRPSSKVCVAKVPPRPFVGRQPLTLPPLTFHRASLTTPPSTALQRQRGRRPPQGPSLQCPWPTGGWTCQWLACHSPS